MTPTIRRILVAVDLAEPRDAAFDRAVLLARGWNAELYLLHAQPRELVARYDVSGQDLELARREAERSQLRALVRSTSEDGVDVRVITAGGEDPVRAIAAHAHLVEADLIVMAQDFGASRVWRRPGVAAAVGRSAPVPVLIVPSLAPVGRGAAQPFKKILVAVDFTVASAVALRVATDLITHGERRGTIVHALTGAWPMVFSGSEAFGLIDYLRAETARAEARLRRAIPARARHRLTPRVVSGTAGTAILNVAADVDADLLVMGVPRRSRLEQLLFGSTFRHVVRRSLRPILAVPVEAGAYRWAGTPAARVNEGDLRAA